MKTYQQKIIFIVILSVLTGCASTSQKGETMQPSEIVERQNFNVDLKNTHWEAIRSEFYNGAGNFSQDGRGKDEWAQSISFDAQGNVSWWDMDLMEHKIVNQFQGTYTMDQLMIYAKASDETATVQELTFEMCDGNELLLEFPENTFVYFQLVDQSDWSDDYISVSQLQNTTWHALYQKECIEACEVTNVDSQTHYETVTFYEDERAYWSLYNASSQEIEEIDGYWKIEGEQIVVYKNEDFQYFTYSSKCLHRTSGGAIEYIFERTGGIE